MVILGGSGTDIVTGGTGTDIIVVGNARLKKHIMVVAGGNANIWFRCWLYNIYTRLIYTVVMAMTR